MSAPAVLGQVCKKGLFMEVAEIIALYVDCIRVALPFTLVFWICDFIVGTILRAAFGGRLTFRGVR